jgi:hypothetical protein
VVTELSTPLYLTEVLEDQSQKKNLRIPLSNRRRYARERKANYEG